MRAKIAHKCGASPPSLTSPLSFSSSFTPLTALPPPPFRNTFATRTKKLPQPKLPQNEKLLPNIPRIRHSPSSSSSSAPTEDELKEEAEDPFNDEDFDPTKASDQFMLRPYQIECVEACLAAWKNNPVDGRRQLVSLPVGSGKTVIFAEIIKRLMALSDPSAPPSATKFLFLVHRQELIDQAFRTLKKTIPDLRIGIEKGHSRCDPQTVDIVLASVASLGRNASLGSNLSQFRLQNYHADDFKAIFIDEAHHATSSSYLRILDYMRVRDDRSHIKLWGCTATAQRHDGQALGAVFSSVTYYISLIELMRQRYLCDLVPWRIITDSTLLIPKKPRSLDEDEADFNVNQLSQSINTPDRNLLIVRCYHQFLMKERLSTLIFACDVNHCFDLFQLFNEYFADVDNPKWSSPIDSDFLRDHVNNSVDVADEFDDDLFDANNLNNTDNNTDNNTATGDDNNNNNNTNNDEGIEKEDEEVEKEKEKEKKIEKKIFEMMIKDKSKVAVVTGSTPELQRANIVELFRNREIKVLINCGVFTEGTDLPCIDSIILARPTLSTNLFYQMIGRGLRRYPQKKNCLVVDVIDKLEGHMERLVTVPSLFGIPPSYETKGKNILTVYDEISNYQTNRVIKQGIEPKYSVKAQPLPHVHQQLNFTVVSDEVVQKITQYEWVLVQDETFTRYLLSSEPSTRNAILMIEIVKNKKKINRRDGGIEDDNITEAKEHSPSKYDLFYSWDGRNIAEEKRPSIPLSYTHTKLDYPLTKITPPDLPPITYKAVFQVTESGRRNSPHVVAQGASLSLVKSAAEDFMQFYFADNLVSQQNNVWRNEPASSKQIEFLKKLKIFPPDKTFSKLTKGEAWFLYQQRILKQKTGCAISQLEEDNPNYHTMTDSPVNWLQMGSQGYILSLKIKHFKYIEVTPNMVGKYDLWYVKGKTRRLIPATEADFQILSSLLRSHKAPVANLLFSLLRGERLAQEKFPQEELDFKKRSSWKGEPASQKQFAFLQQLGYSDDGTWGSLTKGAAKLLIDRALHVPRNPIDE